MLQARPHNDGTDDGDAALAESGEDALPDDLEVELSGARLQVAGGVFVEEAPDLQGSLVPRGDVRSREGLERGIRRCESKFQFRLEAVESLPFPPLFVPPD